MNNKEIANSLLKVAKDLVEEKPIKFSDFKITKDDIQVSGVNTSFANYERQDFSDDKISEAMKKLKEVKAQANKQKVKLKNYDKRLKELKELDVDYKKKAKEYNKKFDQLVSLWKKIEKKKDLFFPPLTDLEKRIPEYDKAIKLGNEIYELFHQGEVLSQVNKIDYTLDRVLRDLKGSSEYTMIAV